MANTYLYKNQGTATNAKKFTYSVWLKRSAIDTSASQRFYQGWQSSDNRFYAYFVEGADSNEDRLWIYAVTGGTVEVYWVSNRRFRDTNAWYHIVFSADSTQASQGDRFKVYVNGVEETSWTKTNNPSQNIDWGNQLAQTNGDLTISGTEGQTQMFDGLMSHIHFIDGTAYDASAFGSTDATTGEWKINTSPSVTYGSQGYFILKDDNSNLDRSGNNNHFTIGGTLTKTEDNPSNVFATLNPLEKLGSNLLIYAGNTAAYNTSSDWRTMISNLAFPNTGKFYAEMKVEEVSSAVQVGIMAQSSFSGAEASQLGQLGQYNSYGYKNNGEKISNSSSSSYGNSFAGGIIGIAVDMDNKNIYFSKDGVWQNSGNPESGATGTGAAFTDLQNDKDYMFAAASQGSNPEVFWNFGNGIFDRTLVSSAGTNASGIGIFEYDVPTGYTALSTKGLNL